MKLAIFDKDGTLVRPASGGKFVQNPEDQMLLPGVAQGITEMVTDGWTIAIASNQGGVVAGYKSLNEAIEEMRFAMKLIWPLLNWPENLRFRGILCPDSGKTAWAIDAFCSQGNWKQYEVTEPIDSIPRQFRKPDAGMIFEAINSLRFSGENPDSVLFIGDLPEDEQAAAAAGVRFQWADEWRAQHV